MQNSKTTKDHFTGNIQTDMQAIKKEFGESFDLIAREILFGELTCYVFVLDGMCDEIKITESIIKPLTDVHHSEINGTADDEIRKRLFKGTNMRFIDSVQDAALNIISGNLVLIADKSTQALAFSVQGFPKKAITDPQTEQNERGSREGFSDNFKDNASLLRKRLRTPELIIKQITLGKTSNTPILVCYLKDRVSGELLDKVTKRLNSIKLDNVMGAGCIRPFLDRKRPSLFTDTGITERPDTLTTMLLEGRIGIIADGTPFALIVPYLFIDYFHTTDDYLSSTYYSLFMRTLRIICFLTASLLPGTFVAICLFHPEIMPADIMYGISAATSKTPFPIMIEALIIHFIYEIVREAGLRMPRSVGHAVSIVGALVIGDAAVTAGLIAAPMLIVVALTAISSSVIVKLHEPMAILRFGFIIIGGFTGLYGIMLGFGIMLMDICSVSPYGIPLSAPISPFVSEAQKDAVLRQSWTKRKDSKKLIQRMKF